jgi:signal transduction histidine kinase/DNA-binding response OmpR family regulator
MQSRSLAGLPDFLVGGGEMGRLLRSMDWSSSPLGPIGSWPQSLRTTVSLCLASTFPISLAWGPARVQIYNDGYWPICGGKHPQSMGQDYKECWASAWPVIGAAFERGLRGEASYIENQRMFLDRNGYLEETFFTFSFSPIRDETGGVGGLFHPVTEQTGRMLSARRTRALRDLTARTVSAKTSADVFRLAARSLAEYDLDIPFALFYALGPDGTRAELAACSGLIAGNAAAPAAIDWDTRTPWPLADVVQSGQSRQIDGLARQLGSLACGPYPNPPDTALMLPILPGGSTRPLAVMIVGISSRLALDESYRGFVDLLASAVTGAAINARAYEGERQRAEALAELDRAKTAFFSNVSHEFRTPLTLMLGPIEDALDDVSTGLASPQRDRLEVARRNALRLLKLVNTLLDFSRIEAGRVQARFMPTDLAALTTDLASNFRSLCDKAGLALVVDCPPLTQPVHVDREMWERIVINLISNAFKFTWHGRIEVRLAQDRERVGLSVRDTGVGIPREQLPHVFDRFHRVEGSAGRSLEGSGIGLALVQELVKLHGGAIGVESEVGAGSIFHVTIPLGRAHLPPEQVHDAPVLAAPMLRADAFVEEAMRWLPSAPGEPLANEVATVPPPPLAARQPEAGSAAAARVLVADDNADMRGYVCRLLEAAGYGVTAVADGAAALDACLAAPPDLLVSDVMMPGLDGFALLQRLRADPITSGMPVILLSARAGEEARIEGLAAGADDYIVKPFGGRELLARVEAAISLFRHRREAAAREHELLEQVTNARALVALRESETRLKVALEAGRLGSWELNMAQGNTIRSAMHDKIFGYDEPWPQWALPEFLQHVIPEHRERVEADFRAAVAQKRHWEVQCQINRADGQVRWIEVFGYPVFDDQGKLGQVFGIVADITDRKQTEAALRHAQKMEAVGTLTGGLAHDFNNLLAIVIGNLDLLPARVRGDPESEELVNEALQASFRGAELTSRLLAFARRQTLQPQTVDINDRVAGIVKLLRRTLGEQIEIVLNLGADIWPAVVDPSQLEASLANLATNARDAMPNGGRVQISTANRALEADDSQQQAEVAAGDYVMIEVRDSGAGMPPEVVGRIFEPFFTTKEPGKGTGLGLSMVFGFIKQSGGHVNVQSAPGQGTAVRLFLPRAAAGAQAEVIAKPHQIVGGNETILVVDDNAGVRRIVAMQLSRLGYAVLEAENSDAALRTLASHRVDLLLSDVVMPGALNGLELARAATARWPGLGVVLTSGFPQAGPGGAATGAEHYRLLTKPYRRADLSRVLREALAERRVSSSLV